MNKENYQEALSNNDQHDSLLHHNQNKGEIMKDTFAKDLISLVNSLKGLVKSKSVDYPLKDCEVVKED